jgi:glycine cleavage system H protein
MRMGLENLKFTKDHEWVNVIDGIATVGITDYAQKELGDIVYVELPSIGDSVAKDDAVSNIESVKAVSDLNSPLTGEIVEVNEALEDTPESINQSPYEDGWILKIKVANEDELNDLMNEEDYKKYLEGIE